MSCTLHLDKQCILLDTNIKDRLITNGIIRDVQSWQRCSSHCKKNAECHAWSYFPTAEDCKLRNSDWRDGLRKVDSGAISGVKDAVLCAGMQWEDKLSLEIGRKV